MSCPTASFGAGAVDFAAVPTFSTRQALLTWFQDDYPGETPADGWALDEVGSRWLRTTDKGHVIGIVTMTRAGEQWTFSGFERCAEDG